MAVKHEQENGLLLDDDGRTRRTGDDTSNFQLYFIYFVLS
jgi:hypothetical protein